MNGYGSVLILACIHVVRIRPRRWTGSRVYDGGRFRRWYRGGDVIFRELLLLSADAVQQ